MGRWLEHSVTTEINAPVERVWHVWSDLEAMPQWMRWIESVVTVPHDPDLTDWTLVAQGFRFHWQARIASRVEAQQLHWESVGGLPTKGAVRFYPQAPQPHRREVDGELRVAWSLGAIDGTHHPGGDRHEGAAGKP